MRGAAVSVLSFPLSFENKCYLPLGNCSSSCAGSVSSQSSLWLWEIPRASPHLRCPHASLSLPRVVVVALKRRPDFQEGQDQDRVDCVLLGVCEICARCSVGGIFVTRRTCP